MASKRPGGDFPGLDRARRKRCTECKALHIHRDRRPGWCLTCDLMDRYRRGESPEALADRFDLPRFLVREVVKAREAAAA